MAEGEKVESGGFEKFPFEVKLDARIDPSDVIFRIVYKELPSSEEQLKLKKAVEQWADKGIEEGYGEGVMHYLDEEFNWNEKGRWVEFAADLGSESNKATMVLFEELPLADSIKEIKVGSGYEW